MTEDPTHTVVERVNAPMAPTPGMVWIQPGVGVHMWDVERQEWLTAESPKVAAVPATLDVTLQVPLDQLLASYTERVAPYRGGDDDDPEPPRVLDAIGERVAQILADGQRKEVQSFVRETMAATIKAQVDTVVRDAMTTPVQRTNEYGQPKGAPTTLAELVVAEVHDWLTKEVGDYNRRQTNLAKFVAAEVDKAIKEDLAGALKTARGEVTQRLRDKAAEALAATVASMARV